MSDDSDDEVPNTTRDLKARPGCFLLLIPVGLVMAIVVGYILMFASGIRGRPADGDRVEVAFTGCPAARPLIEERVALMGLGDPTFTDVPDGFVMAARMPADRRVAAGIPATLVRSGRFEVRVSGEGADSKPLTTGEQVSGATVHFASMGGKSAGVTLIQLDGEASEILRKHMVGNPDGRVTWWLDGQPIGEKSNIPPEARGRLEIDAPGADGVAQLEEAAARSILLEAGPLPCVVAAGEPRVIN